MKDVSDFQKAASRIGVRGTECLEAKDAAQALISCTLGVKKAPVGLSSHCFGAV